MSVRFKNKSDIFNVLLTAVFAIVSVGMMLFGVLHFGLSQTWPELVLNLFYIACLVLIGMYFFQCGITTKQFNYWCTVCLGVTVLLRDILFAPPLAYYSLHLACLTLSVALVLLLTFFYARKDWKNYAILAHALKSNSRMIGAAALSETAGRLEAAADAGQTEVIRQAHDDMIARYTALAGIIEGSLGTQAHSAADDEILEFLPEGE